MTLTAHRPTIPVDTRGGAYSRDLFEVLVDSINALSDDARRLMIATLRERDPGRRWFTNAGGFLMP